MNDAAMLRERLKKLGKNQTDLANALHFSPSYISKVATGAYRPPPGVKSAIEAQLSNWENTRKEAKHGTRPER